MPKRFKLLFLGEHEEYITDVGCSVDARVLANTEYVSSAACPDVQRLLKSGVDTGRVRIASSSLYLDVDSLDITRILQIGTEYIQVQANQMVCIPVVSKGRKTRLFKSQAHLAFAYEVHLGVHPSHIKNVFTTLLALHDVRNDKDRLQSLVTSIVGESTISFDLTSLSSHREVLLLPQPAQVVRIKKMLEIPGLLQVTKTGVYFQSIPSYASKRVKRFSFTDGITVTMLRYKLVDTGVELQFSDDNLGGKSLTVVFGSKFEREKFIKTIANIVGITCSIMTRGDDYFNTGWDTHQAPRTITTTIPPLHAVTELWRSCSISNFSYLMYLNFLAGRSLNDIGQYPILPWTVRDMSSESLDFSNDSIYRDLSLAMAATNEVKLSQAIDRAKFMADDEKFLFGSFYSNPAYVLYFLIRKYPECHLRLHGGHFDNSNRLFKSMTTALDSCTMELTPEFYSNWESADEWLTSPALLSREVCDVELPPWTNGSAETFVILMRCALESKHVSATIHEWIDLVFGIKSRGREICSTYNNLFHPVCYLTNVDTDVQEYCKLHDAVPSVVVLQSQEFGHVPSQLFVAEPHVERNIASWREEFAQPQFYKTKNAITWLDEIRIAMT